MSKRKQEIDIFNELSLARKRLKDVEDEVIKIEEKKNKTSHRRDKTPEKEEYIIDVNDKKSYDSMLEAFSDDLVNLLAENIEDHEFPARLLAKIYKTLMQSDYITETSSKIIYIKFGNVVIKYIIRFKSKKSKKQSDNLQKLSKFGVYKYEGLPKIAKILICGCLLTSTEIDNRLNLMNSNEATYKSHKRNNQETMAERIIKVLAEDLVAQWLLDYNINWQQLTRSFLIGVQMENLYLDSNNKMDTMKLMQSTVSKVIKSKEINEIFDSIINEISINIENNIKNIITSSKKNLTNRLKTSFLI